MKIKYRILRTIDVAGLQILDPVVRLCFAEEPRVQLRRIGQFIVIPTITFLLFLGVWAYLGPRHTTKAGEVPTPGVVLDAGGGVMRFHEWENIKGEDFTLGGEERLQALRRVEARIAELEPLAAAAAENLREVEAAGRDLLAADMEPLNDAYQAKRAEFAEAKKEREARLLELASKSAPGDNAAASSLVLAVAEHEKRTAVEMDEIKRLRDERTELSNRRNPDLLAARKTSNSLEEELQFLRKRRDLLTSENRTLKTDQIASALAAAESTLIQSNSPEERLKQAGLIVSQREVLAQAEAASYSRPWTLPAQINRSLLCVFTGFIIASLIAIPLGVFCGLSSVIMAALTPLISLFKPVSPIVWLPIVFIIVGGFIPDPSNSTLLNFFNALPLFGAVDTNPAFLASAITVALCSLWPTLVNTALGVAAVDKDHLNVARVLRLGFFSRLFRIVVPSALPLIFAGLRISLGVGWMVLIAAELLSSSEGIGKFVWDMFNNGSSQTFAQMFVVVFVVGIIGLALDRIMIVFQRLVSFDGAPTSL